MCRRGSTLALYYLCLSFFYTLHHFLSDTGATCVYQDSTESLILTFFLNFLKKLESCMFSSVKTVEIHIFSCSNRVFARIFVRGSIHRVPSLCGIRSWSFLKVPDAPPWLNWRRNMTPCHVRAQVGLNSSWIPEPSSGVRESSLVGNIDQAGAWSQLS